MAKENNKDRILKLLKECKNHQTAESIKYSEKHSEWNFKRVCKRRNCPERENTTGYIFLHTTRRSITRGSIYNIYWSRSKFKRRSREV